MDTNLLVDEEILYEEILLAIVKQHTKDGYVDVDRTFLYSELRKGTVPIQLHNVKYGVTYNVDREYRIFTLDKDLSADSKIAKKFRDSLRMKELQLVQCVETNKIYLVVPNIVNSQVTTELEKRHNLCCLKTLFEKLENIRISRN